MPIAGSLYRSPPLRCARIAGAALLCLASAHAGAAAIFKCTAADGQVVFRDTPCAVTATQQEIHVHSSPAQGANATTPSQASTRKNEPAAPMNQEGREPKDCGDWVAPPWTVKVDAPAKPDQSQLPRDAQGQPIVASGPGMNLVAVQKPDAISVQNTCSAMITACWHKDNDPRNSMDACFNSAPRCTTARPWEEAHACCPESCWQKYSDLRRSCVDPLTASTKALFDEHCVPGVAEMLNGQPQ